ncbi:Dfp1/Him1, central region-domain-containing protein [Nemania sp. FL0916]|nr:Dfp1/Him1, central region-domain-containing protein [Nemania sp. FL0916]
MAAISLSPTPVAFPAMSSRRVPLSSNQNVANSPLRSNAFRPKRTPAQFAREELYGQPPPAKKLVLDASTQRVVKSPSQSQQSQQLRVSKSQIPVQTRRRPTSNNYDLKQARERAAARQQQQEEAAAASGYMERDIEAFQAWKNHHCARFPKSLFYFDQVPSDIAHKLKRQIAALGGRETAFFSVDVTHVVTSRSIPAEDATTRNNGDVMVADKAATQSQQEQTETINPSLLTRNPNVSPKRRIFDTELRARMHKIPPQPNGHVLGTQKKAADILIRARDMNKKIWSIDKVFRILSLLLEGDAVRGAEMAYGRQKISLAKQPESREAGDRNLLQLLQKERTNGPAPADGEMVYFKGPYIFVYDVEEKQKPIMAREYNKVADRSKGEWPQFQTAALGRCPFIEDSDVREARKAKEAAKEAAAREAQKKAQAKADNREIIAEGRPKLQAPKMAPPKPITGKRTLGEMELGHNRQSSVPTVDGPSRSQSFGRENMDFSRKAFTSHAATGRVHGGEPVASGVQPSKMTSAIRSQMVSSTAITPGVVTGISKEIHCLQRQVLKWPSAAASQDQSSRHPIQPSFREENSIKHPPTLGRASSRKLELVGDSNKENEGSENRRPVARAARKKQQEAELKPGYCENCAEKYADFDQHIESANHRKFAENDENWVELDDLLAQIERIPKRQGWKPSPSWSNTPENDMFDD